MKQIINQKSTLLVSNIRGLGGGVTTTIWTNIKMVVKKRVENVWSKLRNDIFDSLRWIMQTVIRLIWSHCYLWRVASVSSPEKENWGFAKSCRTTQRNRVWFLFFKRTVGIGNSFIKHSLMVCMSFFWGKHHNYGSYGCVFPVRGESQNDSGTFQPHLSRMMRFGYCLAFLLVTLKWSNCFALNSHNSINFEASLS